MVTILQRRTPTGILRWEWVDPQGVVHDFTRDSSPNLFIPSGTKGLGLPPVDLITEKLPNTPGVIVRRINKNQIIIELPIVIKSTSMTGVVSAMSNLYRWFDTGDEKQRRPGYLRITRPQDDVVRQILCYRSGGLTGDLSEGGPDWVMTPVELLAPYPAWTDIVNSQEEWDQAEITAGNLSVLVNGTQETFPVWTIHGPASDITLTNSTTGKTLPLTANGGLTLSSLDTLYIDTRPTNERTTLQIVNQSNVFYGDRVAGSGSYWTLNSGQNRIVISASGMGVGTYFRIEWLNRYEGVLR